MWWRRLCSEGQVECLSRAYTMVQGRGAPLLQGGGYCRCGCCGVELVWKVKAQLRLIERAGTWKATIGLWVAQHVRVRSDSCVHTSGGARKAGGPDIGPAVTVPRQQQWPPFP